ncbi:hypothetical protein Goklo_021831, partial [Gossypium klotzschianum]|nr:hypothetical protein [Gossypium klotzschianum]
MIIEGDARSIIRKLQREEDDRSIISAYIKDSKELSKKFDRCFFFLTCIEESKWFSTYPCYKRDNKRGGHLSEGRVPDFVVAEAEHDRN